MDLSLDNRPPIQENQGSEKRFLIIALITFAIHLGFIIYLRSIDISKVEPPTIEEIPQRIAKLIMNKPEPKDKKKIETASKSTKKVEEVAQKQTTSESSEPGMTAAQSKAKKVAQVQVAQRAVRVERELRSTGMLALLTGVGPTRSRSRAAVDIMGGQGVKGTDLDAALKGVTGVARAGSESDLETKLTTRRVVSTTEKVSITDMVKGFGSAGKQFDKLGDIQVSKPKTIGAAPQSANRNESSITDFVKKNMRSILAEYNRLLKNNPSLTGKITIRFTILPEGKVIDVEIVDSSIEDDALQSRMVRVISNWVFPAIGSGEGNLTVNYPFIFQPN